MSQRFPAMRATRFCVGGEKIYIQEQLLADGEEDDDDDDAVDAFFMASESLAGSTGQKVWDSALLAVRYLETHAEMVRDKRVLELGCGTGLVGLSCAALGACEVVLTDMASVVAYCALGNVDANPGLAAVCEPLDWLQFEQSGGASYERCDYDVIVASDCVWLVELLPAFAFTMAALLARRPGCVALLAQTERSTAYSAVFSSTEQLVQLLRKRQVDVQPQSDNIFLLRAQPL